MAGSRLYAGTHRRFVCPETGPAAPKSVLERAHDRRNNVGSRLPNRFISIERILHLQVSFRTPCLSDLRTEFWQDGAFGEAYCGAQGLTAMDVPVLSESVFTKVGPYSLFMSLSVPFPLNIVILCCAWCAACRTIGAIVVGC